MMSQIVMMMMKMISLILSNDTIVFIGHGLRYIVCRTLLYWNMMNIAKVVKIEENKIG